MTHPLETENEELQKRLEATYDEILDVECKISSYVIMEMSERITNQATKMSSVNAIMNDKSFKDIINWGNKK